MTGNGVRRGRGRAVAVVGLAALMAFGAGCTGSPTRSAGPVPADQVGPSREGVSTPHTAPAAPPATIAMQPRNGTADFSPGSPVIVRTGGGTLTSVSLVAGRSAQVTGTLSADHTRWIVGEQLRYGTTYTLSAAARNPDGTPTTATSRFSTVTPGTFTLPAVFPSTGMTVGVGQPISVRFDEPITDRAAAERALEVTTSPAVSGRWHWFGDQVVHWRPQKFWTPGTKVTVRARLYGVRVGAQVYGQRDVTSSFAIGRSKIATIDDRTHMMTVRFDGQVVRQIPVSMGRGGQVGTSTGKTIYFTTQSGPHIVAEKYPVKHMTSASYGLPESDPLGYAADIPLAVRISPDGEFVHALARTVPDQGVRNVSHGCVNISPSNAEWFYPRFGYGDIVDIQHTGADLPFAAGYNEWDVSWSTWLAGSALR